jgi:hypothetical protein
VVDNNDPFAGYNPEEEEYEKHPVIQLASKGDTFKVKITRVGKIFDVDYGKKFPIEGELTYVGIKPLEEIVLPGGRVAQRAYTPPTVGETVVFFAYAEKQDGKTHHVFEEIQKAAKKAGTQGIDEGGELAGKLIDLIKNSNPSYQPFKKHAFLYTPPVEKTEADPFGGQPPF